MRGRRRHGDKIIDTYDVRCDDTDIRYTCHVRMVKRETATTFRIVCDLLELSVSGDDIDTLKKEMKREVNEKGKLPWSRWYQIEVTHLSGKDAVGDDSQPVEQRGIRIDLTRLLRSGIGKPEDERYRPANVNWTPSQNGWTQKGQPQSGASHADNDNWNSNDPSMTSLIEATPEVEKAIGQIMARISELYDRLAGILSPGQISESIKSITAGVPVLALPAPPPAPKKRARARR